MTAHTVGVTGVVAPEGIRVGITGGGGGGGCGGSAAVVTSIGTLVVTLM